MSPKLCAIALAIVPPLMLLTRMYGKYVKSITKQVQDSLASSTEVNMAINMLFYILIYLLSFLLLTLFISQLCEMTERLMYNMIEQHFFKNN